MNRNKTMDDGERRLYRVLFMAFKPLGGGNSAEILENANKLLAALDRLEILERQEGEN